MECKKCGYEWNPKYHRPKECPNCKTRNYWDDSKCFICEKLMQVVHHINGNREDNSTINLLPLCFLCHYRIHNPKKKIDRERFDSKQKMLLKKYTNLFFKSNHRKYIKDKE